MEHLVVSAIHALTDSIASSSRSARRSQLRVNHLVSPFITKPEGPFP